MLQSCWAACRPLPPAVLSDPNMRVDGQSIVSGLPVTLYAPLMSKFKVLIIPILALDQWGNACPGVQPFPYGKGVSAA